MYCQQCGTNLPDISVACYKCGLMISQSSLPTITRFGSVSLPTAAQLPMPVKQVVPRPRGNFAAQFILTIFFVVLVAAVGVGGFLLFFVERSQRSEMSVSNSDYQSKQNDIRQTSKKTIFNDSLAVPAGNYAFLKIQLNGQPNLSGEFTTTGGSNDIDCYVVSASEFENLKNGNNFDSFYTRKNITRDNISLNLTDGTYYIIFDNRKAIATNKLVKGKFFVE